MSEIKVRVDDGIEEAYSSGTTCLEVCRDHPQEGKNVFAAVVNGRECDLNSALKEDCTLTFIDFDTPRGARVYRHSASHILAQAVKKLYPKAKLGIGPAIEHGFYYDFDFEQPISATDLDQIEQEMKKIIKEKLPIKRRELSREEAVALFEEKGEQYKVELIDELPCGTPISIYGQGDFIDLCAGPHLPHTGMVKAVRLTGLAGAYWRGDEKNPMLQRIYGTAFPSREQLERHLDLLEEAKKRDHRKLGRELDLFSLHDEGPGFPFFHSNGMVIWQEMTDFWRHEHRRAGYEEIKTPVILNRQLWEQSGHWDHYRNNMYFTRIDEQDYAVKPMNCPGAMLVYRSRMHSYRDFPRRIAEMGLVHRHELSGTLHGLMRVRSFTQDDAHIFMLPDQVESEVAGVIELVDRFYQVFGFDYRVELSTRPEKALGSAEMWDKATAILEKVLNGKGLDYKINHGDGAFYGPKIDFHLQDCLGRRWQCSTIQLDFQMPEKFDLSYIGEDGRKHRPVVIHRVVYGAMERFIALLIEHYAGAFPVWLAPVQAVVIPLTERHHDYGHKVMATLKENSIRARLDERSEKVGYKIREAQLKKIPYMLVVGDREAEDNLVSVRRREQGDQGAAKLEEFVSSVKQEIAS
ncbi:MAG: threonine--tRNA ligase, partial [Dethiobacter sp.]|nr:threonine--tRNA ligase [Dethiobacter sp.]